MSDEMSEMWSELNQFRAEKKLKNKEFSTNFLKERGINFASKNQGTHLIIKHNSKTFDFWPSTGLYKNRNSTEYKRGIKNLLEELI